MIDKGSLLGTKVDFKKGETYNEIIKRYLNITEKYSNCIPVFDGYKDESFSTKHIAHLKRSRKVIPSHTVELALHLPFNCDTKDSFFENKSNKQSFINLLYKAIEDKSFSVKHAKDDADQLIVQNSH